MAFPTLDGWVNQKLLFEPLNWAIVWIAASIALLLFHVLMQGFGAMQTTSQGAFGGPGQIAAPTATADISPNPFPNESLSSFRGGGLAAGDGTWTDTTVARYAEDGWTGNA
jgi:hypothetical protein